MAKITDIYGKELEVECIACAIQRKEVEVPAGVILEGAHFQLEQDMEVPVPGFLVLVSKRHIFAVDEFTEDEQKEFMSILVRARSALRKEAEVETVYLVLEEDTTNSHFHLWLVPIYPWMTERFGRGISNVKTMMKYARESMKTEESLAQVDNVVRSIRTSIEASGY